MHRTRREICSAFGVFSTFRADSHRQMVTVATSTSWSDATMAPIKGIIVRAVPARSAYSLRALKHWLTGERELRWLKRLVDPELPSFDIGANNGVYTWWLSRYSTVCHAFEPNPTLARSLEAMVGPSGRTKIWPIALSDKDGMSTLRIPVDPKTGQIRHGLASMAGENQIVEGQAIEAHEVRTARLDDLALPPAGFIKIDVEGHELSVLAGAESFIGTHLPTVLIEAEERHAQGAVGALQHWFEERGYSGYFLPGSRWRQLSRFDLHQHQSESRRPGSGKSKGRGYFNNFLFIGSKTEAAFVKKGYVEDLSRSQ